MGFVIAEVELLPEDLHDEPKLRLAIANKLGISQDAFSFQWERRSLDARKRPIRYNCRFLIATEEEILPKRKEVVFPDVSHVAHEVCIIGAGPAGLFAALQSMLLGIRPIIYEQGKDVRARRRDLAALNKNGIVNESSNYCFGEGGAGTYSDGKLYTRSKKRGDIRKVLEWLVQFGANEDILVDAHPHIGTNKLPQIIVSMREEIIRCGGEVHFSAKLTDLRVENSRLLAIQLNDQNWRNCEHLILATGHSARDIYHLLHNRGIRVESKPFALGVRIEHPQRVIDNMQYRGRGSDDELPPAAYSMVTQVEGRGVYSFCMCPGGIVAPCATRDGEVVTNGWSPSRRNNPFANSGIVVSIFPEDFEGHQENPFVCLDFQQYIERKAYELGGGQQKVPAQRLMDFLEDKKSIHLPNTSYHPGLTSVRLSLLFPPFVERRLKQAFLDFSKKAKGFMHPDAVLHAPESRTSSPVLIPRNPETLEHQDVIGLYPCAEGAGYAGGIVSAAMDGMKVAKVLAIKLSKE